MQGTSLPKPDWLTTTQAAERLGVHPSTIRRWADDGNLPAMVTPGGHRRFAAADLDWMADEGRQPTGAELPTVWAQHALANTRTQISASTTPAWLTAFGEHDRQRGRELGRRLLALILRYVSLPEGGDELLHEVGQLGQGYAATAQQAGLNLKQAMEIAMFFRDNLVETTFELPAEVPVRPEHNVRLLRRLNPVMNALQLAVVDAYKQAEGSK